MRGARDKTFLGYSDGGALLAGLYRAGIGRQVHGPMPTDIRRAGGEAAVRRSLAFLCGDETGLESSLGERPTIAIHRTDRTPVRRRRIDAPCVVRTVSRLRQM